MVINLFQKSIKIESLDLSFYSDFAIKEECEEIQKICVHTFDDNSSMGFQSVDLNSKHIFRDIEFGDLLTANDMWTEVHVYPSKYSNPQHASVLTAIYSRLAFDNVLLCHSSIVNYNGKGIMFLGKSGIGKTTQAELWNRFKGAKIINGDKAFIGFKNNECCISGLPWKGSSPYCLNETVELAGVISLGQSSHTHIHLLEEFEKPEKIMTHIFLPHWDDKCMSAALETTDKLLRSNIPMFYMECKPDIEAVETVLKVLDL